MCTTTPSIGQAAAVATTGDMPLSFDAQDDDGNNATMPFYDDDNNNSEHELISSRAAADDANCLVGGDVIGINIVIIMFYVLCF